MSDDVFDPAEAFEEIDLEVEEFGFNDEDLDEVVDKVKGSVYQYSGHRVRVRKAEIDPTNEAITQSQQLFWLVAVEVDWYEKHKLNMQRLFQSEIWATRNGWVEVRVGHERAVSREEAESEAEWLAEQATMIENDPNVHT